MDKTHDSHITPAQFGPMTTRFPGSDLNEVARLSPQPDLLLRYLARSNDLTLPETEEILATLSDRPRITPEQGALQAA